MPEQNFLLNLQHFPTDKQTYIIRVKQFIDELTIE